ncbi:MAG: hypothetical protein KDB88_09635 [Flavobacteriales bacterium]|nr:hypothetical protein [Flavobacteriales bacterium]
MTGHIPVSFVFITTWLLAAAMTVRAQQPMRALPGYDSLVVRTVIDHRFEPPLPGRPIDDRFEVTRSVRLSPSDAREIDAWIRSKASYGSSQAVTPVPDVEVLYYWKGTIKEKVEMNLFTHNLYASFPLRQQRQGDCLCRGSSGHCCTAGGMNAEFTQHVVDLLVRLGWNPEEFLME